MTFAWKQLEGVTYQCSFNGQAAEDCELSAALEASLPSLHVVEHLCLLLSRPFFQLSLPLPLLPLPSFPGFPDGFTVNTFNRSGNILVITLLMDSQLVGEQSFSEPVAACVGWLWVCGWVRVHSIT